MGTAVPVLPLEGKKYKNLTPTMKAFVAVTLAAAAQAAPEADPQVLLAQPLVYGNAHTQVEAQVQHANGAVVPGETLSVKAAKAQHLTAKANAYLNKPLVCTAPVVRTPVVHQTLPDVHQTVASPVVSYTGYPLVPNTRFIKREADAEAQPEAEADPALLIPGTYRGVYSAGVVGAHHLVKPITYTTGLTTPVVGTVDTGLKFHPASGAVTPDFTEAQKEAAPELAANQKAIKHLAYTGHVVQPVHPIHTTAYLYGKREAEAEPAAEAEADPALLYTNGVHHVAPVVTAPVVAPAVYTQGGLVAHPNGAVTPDYTPAQKVAAATHLAAKGIHPVFHTGAYLYGKRDAEAKPDAWSVYGYPGVYTGAYGYPYGGVYHYGKRDAEAESDAWGVYGYPSVYTGAYGYPYGGVYHYGKC